MGYIGNQIKAGSYRRLTDISGSFNGVTTTFTTSVFPGTPEYYVTAGTASQLLISLGGVIQEPDVDYSVSTNSITFSTPPTAGLSFFGVLMGDAVTTSTPPDGSITTAKLASGLTVDLASGTVSAPSLTFDANSGLYSPGEDQVAVATNGTQRLLIDGSGQIEATSIGSAAAPTWSYVGDPNTGTYSPGADQWAVSTGGTGRLFVDASGNVGFNVNPPTSYANYTTLSINGTTGGLVSFRSGGTMVGEVFSTSSALKLGTNTGQPLVFETNGGSERARIDSSGRLLVGTSTARGNNNLQLEGGFDDLGIFLRRNQGAATIGPNVGTYLGGINFGNTDGAVGAYIRGESDATWGSNDYPSRLVFSTTADGASSPTERMRISNDGQTNVLSTGNAVSGRSTQGAGTTYRCFFGTHSSTTVTDGTISFTVWTNGNVVNTNNSYGSLSDLKLKENIVDATSQWDDIKALQVRKYNFKEGQTHTQIGLIAQEVELVSPGLVTESPDRDAEGNDLGTTTKSVNYSVLYMKAVKALQEAMDRIETLEAEMAEVKSQLA